MILSEHTTEKLSRGAIAITLFSTLIGGHLTASYLIYQPGPIVVQLFLKIVLAVVVLNILYFLVCIGYLFLNNPYKSKILKACLFMLINIPVAIGYLTIVLSYTL